MSSFVINPYRFASAEFSPLDISGCVAWFDFSDTTTMFTDTAGTTSVSADNDAIARINDKSSGGYNLTQATAANQPAYKTSIQNSLSVARFSSDWLSSSSNFSITGSANRSVFTVASRSATGGFYCIVGWGANVTMQFARFNAEYSLRFTGAAKIYSTAVAQNTWAIWSVIGGGSTLGDYDAYFDDGSVATPSSTLNLSATINTASSVLNVGASIANGDLFFGDIAEILIYDSALSTSDREAVRDYLNAKWAVY